MTDFYINIAQNIGVNSNTLVKEGRQSIKQIKEQSPNQNFEFKIITEKHVSTCIKNLNSKKATGVDSVPPKGHLCLWWRDSLKKKYNTRYYKKYFYLIFRVCK